MAELRAPQVAGHRLPRRLRRVLASAGKVLAAPPVAYAERFGYVVRGLLYGGMGVSALALALREGAHGTDQRGTLPVLATAPGAWLLLAALAAGLAAYAAWGFVRAIYDPLRRGDDVPGLVQRLGFLWSGIAYTALLLVVLQVLLGHSPNLQGDSVQDWVRFALAAPAGTVATFAAGGIGVLAGLGQFVDAWKAGFRKDLQRRDMPEAEYQAAVALGRAGMVSRGVIFAATGWFVLLAAAHRDFQLAHGFGAAFDELAARPLGHLVVGVLGLGFLALALHSIECARFIKLPERS